MRGAPTLEVPLEPTLNKDELHLFARRGPRSEERHQGPPASSRCNALPKVGPRCSTTHATLVHGLGSGRNRPTLLVLAWLQHVASRSSGRHNLHPGVTKHDGLCLCAQSLVLMMARAEATRAVVSAVL